MGTNHNRHEDNALAPSIRRPAPVDGWPGMAAGWSGLAAVLLVGLASLASAQQYSADAVDERAGKLKLTAEQCVKNPARFATDRARFEEFFDKYYFPAMTRYSPDDLAQLGRMREDLFDRFLWASTDENLQRILTDMAFKKMQPIERSSKYHPSVRYNAVLILGMLDEEYATQSRPPIPFKKATAELTLIVDYAAQGKSVPPFLVVGALVGLQRHALCHDKLGRAAVEAMSTAVLKFAVKDELLPDVNSKVAQWMRIQAATVLATLGSPGPNGEVQAALSKMLAGQTVPKMSLDGRCQIAALLPKLKYDGAKVDGQAISEAILSLAVAVADDEAEEAEAFRETQISGSGNVGAPRRKGRLRIDPQTMEWEYDSRILLARLRDLRTGLTTAKALAPADKQPAFDAVLAAIGPAVTAAESSDTIDLALASKVVAMAAQIHDAVKPGSTPAGAADAAQLF